MPGPAEKTIVFCDFDGTVTVQETFSTMLMEFVPDLGKKTMERMLAGELTLAQGVRFLMESLPSSIGPDIINFSKGREVRPGFSELLDFLDEKSVGFVLVSGGLHLMIKTILEPYLHRFAGVYALDLDFSGDNVKVITDYEGEGELISKVRIMNLYDHDKSVAIGDGLTDLNMGLAADLVFARGGLAGYLKKKNRDFHPWEDFFQVRDALEKIWK